MRNTQVGNYCTQLDKIFQNILKNPLTNYIKYVIINIQKQREVNKMKITYSKGYTPAPKLRELEIGEVFRPLNSQQVYISTMYTGLDDIFSETAVEYYYENIQNMERSEERRVRERV